MSEIVSNSFDRTLREMRNGQCVEELSEQLAGLVAAVRLTGRGGSLTFKLTVKPASRGETVALMLTDDVNVKMPKAERPSNIFFANENNLLQRSDPRQKELELRSVTSPAVAELRSVAANPAELRNVVGQ